MAQQKMLHNINSDFGPSHFGHSHSAGHIIVLAIERPVNMPSRK